MSDLTTRLKALAALPDWLGMANDYTDGRTFENTKLSPLVEALIDCVTALERIANPRLEMCDHPAVARHALTRLKEIAGET